MLQWQLGQDEKRNEQVKLGGGIGHPVSYTPAPQKAGHSGGPRAQWRVVMGVWE